MVPAEGDLIQVCADREIINDEVCEVGALLNDQSTAERLRFRDVIEVEAVYLYENGAARQMQASEWCSTAKKRKIDFTGSVPAGTQYSIRYIAAPEYIISANSAQPLLRVAHDDSLKTPERFSKDLVYPYFARATRLDRAVMQKLRGAQDSTQTNTFNNFKKTGPFT